MGSGVDADPLELGVFRPQLVPVKQLVAGEVGYVATGLKSVRDAQVGDTVTSATHPATEPLPGYQPAKSLVFAGIYPVSGEDYPLLRDALEKLHLNDASFTYEPESSVALGFGFRCGFLGLLHMEIVQERLEREFELDLIASAPSVEYHVQRTLGRGELIVDNPALLPNPTDIEEIREPWVNLSVVTPTNYIGPLMELSTNRRGTFVNMEYMDPTRVVMHFEMPLAELIVDYFDQLKSRSQGYASMDYEELGYRAANLVKVDILVNGEPVDALSLIVHRDRAASVGRQLTERLKQLIPRQMFEIPIQAAIGSNVDRPRDGPRDAQERARQVLRWRHHAQAQAAREAERGQAAHEAGRVRGDPAGGVPRDAADGRGLGTGRGRSHRLGARDDHHRPCAADRDAPGRGRALRHGRVLRGDPLRRATEDPAPAGLVRDRRRAGHRHPVHPPLAAGRAVPRLGRPARGGPRRAGLRDGGRRVRGGLRHGPLSPHPVPGQLVVPGRAAQRDRHLVHR